MRKRKYSIKPILYFILILQSTLLYNKTLEENVRTNFREKSRKKAEASDNFPGLRYAKMDVQKAKYVSFVRKRKRKTEQPDRRPSIIEY